MRTLFKANFRNMKRLFLLEKQSQELLVGIPVINDDEQHQNNSHQFFEFIFNQIWWISILTSASFSAHFTSGIKILKNRTYWDIFRLFWNKPKNKRSCNFAFSSSRSYKIEFISDILILVLLFLFPLCFVIYIFISVKNSQTD